MSKTPKEPKIGRRGVLAGGGMFAAKAAGLLPELPASAPPSTIAMTVADSEAAAATLSVPLQMATAYRGIWKNLKYAFDIGDTSALTEETRIALISDKLDQFFPLAQKNVGEFIVFKNELLADDSRKNGALEKALEAIIEMKKNFYKNRVNTPDY